MGVPSYFRWLFKHFESDIISKKAPYEVIHRLYIDFNGGIHPAARSRPENTQEVMNETIIAYLNYIFTQVKPQKLLYISIDGVAPAAKMKQQRMRRYKSVKETQITNQLKKKYKIPVDEKKQKDFNMISPATDFMFELSLKIQTYIRQIKQKPEFKNLTIIFSDSSVPGEGEHKLLHHIRQSPLEDNCVIYGLDSDLIFLSLSTQRSNVCLVRENTLIKNNNIDLDNEKFPQMTYFLINELRRHIINIMNPYTSLAELEGLGIFSANHKRKSHQNPDYKKMTAMGFFTSENDIYKIIRDYIFISFLLGNDFIPSIEALKIKEGGIERIICAYKNVIQKQCQYLLDDNLNINPVFFKEFLQSLAELEHDLLIKQKYKREKNVRMNANSKVASSFAEAIEEAQYVENLYKDDIDVSVDGWQSRYYDHFFHLKNNESHCQKNQIENICHDYMIALHWIAQYYFTECPDWHWFYLHEATPLLSDLLKYVSDCPDKVKTTRFDKHTPVEPLHQLLTILPPQSSHLLPQELATMMTSNESPIIYYYPIDFECEYYGKKYMWECHPKVPMISPKELSQYVTSIKEKLSISDLQKNKLGEVIEYI